MRVHIVALADIPVQRETPCCAFTTKAYHLTKMLRMRGHHVTLYGCAGTDKRIADETVICIGKKDLDDTIFRHDYQPAWGPRRDKVREKDVARARWELARHIGFGQVEPVCLIVEWVKGVTAGLPSTSPVIESGIGYPFTSGTRYRVFESRSWRAWHWGREMAWAKAEWRCENPFDVVIPNAFDPDMFSAKMKRKPYALFMGRVNEDKGWRSAMDACKVAGLPLKIVGQLPRHGFDEEKFFADISAAGASWEGPAGVDRRKKLMGEALVFFCPSKYNEPFGGVSVEAMLSGCPVITSDWGAFPETVLHGITGFLCHSTREMVEALGRVGKLNRGVIRSYAEANYSLDRISHMYDAYLENVAADVQQRPPAKSMLGIPLRIPPGFKPVAKAPSRKGG